MRIGWIDASGGVSGDMLLGACFDAGVPVDAVRSAITALRLPESVEVTVGPAVRGGLAGTRARVVAADSTHHRSVPDVLALVGEGRAAEVFTALGGAEADVHGVPLDQVHLHEVGALDSIADVVGVVAALDALALDRLVCSPIALGGGRVPTEHGPVPVPGPAVVELLRRHSVPAFGGPIDAELATPTGVALMAVLADAFGPLPAMTPELTGVGAGGRDPHDHANVTRLIVGSSTSSLPVEPAVVLEANVDDLDPRIWPDVLARLMAAGASDAWLTPMLMKKGRPAHTLSVLAEPARADDLARLVLVHTSSIGLRRRAVDKTALPREQLTVDVGGTAIRVKVARLDGAVVNAEPEYDDVAALAAAAGRPVRDVLAEARAAARAAKSAAAPLI